MNRKVTIKIEGLFSTWTCDGVKCDVCKKRFECHTNKELVLNGDDLEAINEHRSRNILLHETPESFMIERYLFGGE